MVNDAIRFGYAECVAAIVFGGSRACSILSCTKRALLLLGTLRHGRVVLTFSISLLAFDLLAPV